MTLLTDAYLLCYNRERGRPTISAARGQLLGAAALADLWLDDRIALDGRVTVQGTRPPADPALADLWTRIRDEPPRRLSSWLRRADADRLAREQLVAAGTIRIDRERQWFRRAKIGLRDTRAHTRLAQRVTATLRGPLPVDRQDPRDTMLVALLATGEVRLNLTREMLREHKRRVDAMKERGGPIVKALRSAVQATKSSA